MTAQSSNAYFISTLIHGAAVGLLLFFAYTTNRIPTDTPKIMELVAGSGDNYGATVAPAAGSPGAIEVKIAEPLPLPPEPMPAPLPVESEPQPLTPSPVQESPLRPAPVSKNHALTKSAPRPPNFVADLKRLERKREARLEAAYQKKLAAQERRLHAEEQAHKQQAAKISHIDSEGIREGVVGGSTENKTGGAGGKALTREEGDLEASYEAFLVQHVKATFEELKPQDVSDALVAKAEFMLAADGSISSARIVRSSGVAEFDRAALESLARTRSVGPRPDHRNETQSITFSMHEDEGP